MVSSSVSNTSIKVQFAPPSSGFIIRINGSGPTTLFSEITDGNCTVFTGIILGRPYNFTLVVVDSNEVSSSEIFIRDVVGKQRRK